MQGEGKGVFVSTYWSKLSFCRRTELGWVLIDQPCSTPLPYSISRSCMNMAVVMPCTHASSCTAMEAISRFWFSAYPTEFFGHLAKILFSSAVSILGFCQLFSLCWPYPETSTVGILPMVTQKWFKVTLGLTDRVITLWRRVWFIISVNCWRLLPFTHSTDGFWDFQSRASWLTEYSTMIFKKSFFFFWIHSCPKCFIKHTQWCYWQDNLKFFHTFSDGGRDTSQNPLPLQI